MQALRILTNCLASGQPLEAGSVYAVPTQVAADDAEALVRMRRAVPAEPEPPKLQPRPKRTRARVEAAADPTGHIES